MLGCSAIVGAVFFLVAIVPLLFVTGMGLGERFLMAAMVGGMAFLACLLLACRDTMAFHSVRRRVQRRLLRRSDMSNEEFCRAFPQHDSQLILDVRSAIAAFFQVPLTKIHPTDNLVNDLAIQALAPSFPSFVADRVLAARHIVSSPRRVVRLPSSEEFGEFVHEVQRILTIAEDNGVDRQ
jgi:hypothetical protein